MRRLRSAVAMFGIVATFLVAGSTTARAAPQEPIFVPMSAPVEVAIGHPYQFTSAACGTGWSITSVTWYIWGPMSHQPVQPQELAPSAITQSDSGIVVDVVAGESGRLDPLWYTKQPVETFFYERILLQCEQDGSVVRTGSDPVRVLPPSGVTWYASPAGPFDAVTGLDVIVTGPSCTVGATATLQVISVPGATGLLSAQVTTEIWWPMARFTVDFTRGGGWRVVDYVFRCPTATGELTSTFHHPDWGFVLASGGTLPSSGATPEPLLLVATVLVALGGALRRASCGRSSSVAP